MKYISIEEFLLGKKLDKKNYFVFSKLNEVLICIPITSSVCVKCVAKRLKSSVWVKKEQYKAIEDKTLKQLISIKGDLAQRAGNLIEIDISQSIPKIVDVYKPLCLENCNDKK